MYTACAYASFSLHHTLQPQGQHHTACGMIMMVTVHPLNVADEGAPVGRSVQSTRMQGPQPIIIQLLRTFDEGPSLPRASAPGTSWSCSSVALHHQHICASHADKQFLERK